MPESANVLFYEVTRCGYYSTNRSTGLQFGSLAEILPQIRSWAAPLQLGQRKTVDVREEGGPLGTYLLDIRESPDLWVVSLWNETETTDGNYAALRVNQQIGDTDVVLTPQPAGTIPGYATYFVVMPSRSLIAGVRFARPGYNFAALDSFMRGFLTTRSPCVATETVDVGIGLEVAVVGYRRPGDPTPLPLTARFRTRMRSLPGDEEELIQNVDRISKIERKATLTMRSEENRTFFQSVLGQLGLRDHAMGTNNVKVRYGIDATLTELELRQMIAEWRANHGDQGYDDLGFAYRGATNDVKWLDGIRSKAEIDLEIRRDNAEVINAESILTEVGRCSAEILRAARVT